MAKKGRKRKLDSDDMAMIDWEREHIMSDELQEEMKKMWEIPQIYHFLHLTKEALNLGPLSMYEMERMLLMPRASKQLAHIMTCLLSSPMLKTKLRRIPPMPYEYWTNILMHKIKNWFKIYHNKHEDTVKVLEAIGVEPAFWTIFPDVSLIEGKDFEELTFKQRVWLLKTVCDAMIHARKTVQEEMAKQLTDEPAETLLGTDRYGARYIYFPQIMENDLRVYRHCLDNKILSTVKPPKVKVELKSEVKTDNKKIGLLKAGRTRRRKGRWRNGSLPPRIRKRVRRQEEISKCKYTAESVTECLGSEDTNLSTTSICINNNHSDLGSERSKRSRSSSKNSEESVISNQTKSSHAKSSGYDTNTSNDAKSNDEMPFRKEFQGFSKNKDTIEKEELVKKDAKIQKSQTIVRPTENGEDQTNSTNTTEVTATNDTVENNIKQIEGGDVNDVDARIVDTNDSQSSVSASMHTKSEEMPSTQKICEDSPSDIGHSGTEVTSDPVSKESETESMKELQGNTTLQVDELSNSSKTDDEKLNDKMSIDGPASDASINAINVTSPIISNASCSNGVEEAKDDVNIDKILSISKSDDQKLIETKLKDDKIDGFKTVDGTMNQSASLCALSNETPLLDEPSDVIEEESKNDDSAKEFAGREFDTRSHVKTKIHNKSNEPFVKRTSERPWRNVRSTYKRMYLSDDNKSEYSSDQEPTLSELKDRLLKENEDDTALSSRCDIPVWEKYNLRKPKKIKKEEPYEIKMEHFHEMLDDLSVSSFELVADSIEVLREVVLTDLLSYGSETINDVTTLAGSTPQCEIRLTKKIRDLLVDLEIRESTLTDATKKARAKLHKEWTNYKDGVVEDQDWSSEGSLGLGSNWWVIGSQGCHPLPPTGDATLSPLSQLTLPSPGTHHQSQLPAGPKRECTDEDNLQEHNTRQEHSQEAEGSREETASEQEGRLEEKVERTDEAGDESENEPGPSSRRVLRARGVSSYMEQIFTSDDDVEEDELEGWPDLEAKYATTCTPPDTPVANSTATSGQPETWESEDSDQDWILPCARKRKNRRPARKLKSLQQKLQNMNGGTEQEPEPEPGPGPEPNTSPSKDVAAEEAANETENLTDSNNTNQIHTSSNLSDSKLNVKIVSDVQYSQTVPSTNPICKIDSVHSEIDIKDEVTTPNIDLPQNANNYNLNMQPGGYVVVKTEQGPMTNYYLMPQTTPVPGIIQQSTIMPNVVPQVQQGYYVQSGQNYIVQAPHQQTNFLATSTLHQQHSQPMIAQQPRPQLLQQPRPQLLQQPRPQLLQHTVAHNYLPMPGYVVHPPTMSPPGPRGFIVNPGARPHFIPANAVRMANQFNARHRAPLVGNGTPFPHGAVIRSSVPLRGNAWRNNRPKSKLLAPRVLAPHQNPPRLPQNNKRVPRVHNAGKNATQNATSLIVLSDSDDEIEMIITEKTKPAKVASTANISSQETGLMQTPQKPVVTSHVTLTPNNSILPPQIMQRMSQGGISITPVKTQQTQAFHNPNTQLVVVVNETGSHYALSLPNGSRLILTPDQVAQIRASNNGKLIL